MYALRAIAPRCEDARLGVGWDAGLDRAGGHRPGAGGRRKDYCRVWGGCRASKSAARLELSLERARYRGRFEELRPRWSRVEVSSGLRKTLTRGVTNETGTLMADRPSHTQYGNVFAVRDPDGAARCAIACYTLQEDAPGEVWINHGNLLSRSFDGTTLEIYLNDKLQFSESARNDRVPLLFQTRLGRLKKGDVIRVAVGPGGKSGKGGGRLGFVVEETAAGTRPAGPVNIFSSAITAAEPQRDADGRYRKYLAKHTAQCEAILANKPELVFIGDSITARWPAELLQERYGKHRPVNLGIGGDWVQNVLWARSERRAGKGPHPGRGPADWYE